jgi:hypothetical protein
MISYLFLPFLFLKVFVLNLLALQYDSAAHNVVGVIHGIFLLDFSFEICDLSVQLFQLVREDIGSGLVLVWSSVEESRGGG